MVLTPLVLPSDSEYTPKITIQELVEALDLNYHVCRNDDLYVARISWRLELLSRADEHATNFHYRMGVFLEYSPADLRHYFESEPADTHPEELVRSGVFQPHVAYTKFLPQRFDDSVDGYERAIERGKAIYEQITSFADEQDHAHLDAYINYFYDMAVHKCSPQK